MATFLASTLIRSFILCITLFELALSSKVFAESCLRIAMDQSMARSTLVELKRGGLTIVMRHLDKNSEGCLTQAGISRAKKMGQEINNLLSESQSWIILHSGICRAKETAEIIALQVDVAASTNGSLAFDPMPEASWFINYAKQSASSAKPEENHLLVTHSQILDSLNGELGVSLPTAPMSDENYGVAYLLSGSDSKRQLHGCIWPDDWSVLNTYVQAPEGR